LLKEFGIEASSDPDQILSVIASQLRKDDPAKAAADKKLLLRPTVNDDSFRIFDYGCDYLTKRFEVEFENALKK
jgi:hypothetical protein